MVKTKKYDGTDVSTFLEGGLQPIVEAFAEAGIDQAWADNIVRDAEYLNWRYLESPKGYVAFGTDQGYAVLGHKRHRGRPIALVADLVADDPRALLRTCLAEARADSRALFALPAPEHRVAYAALGFVPTPLALDFMGKPLAGSLNPDRSSWQFTLGDTDFF